MTDPDEAAQGQLVKEYVSNAKKFIESIYTKRLELKKRKDPLEKPLKIILNSIYGKT